MHIAIAGSKVVSNSKGERTVSYLHSEIMLIISLLLGPNSFYNTGTLSIHICVK